MNYSGQRDSLTDKLLQIGAKAHQWPGYASATS